MHRKIALTILLAALAGTVSAQNRGADFQITKITRNLIASPEFNYGGTETFPTTTPIIAAHCRRGDSKN
jgi:hypothetical protein